MRLCRRYRCIKCGEKRCNIDNIGGMCSYCKQEEIEKKKGIIKESYLNKRTTQTGEIIVQL